MPDERTGGEGLRAAEMPRQTGPGGSRHHGPHTSAAADPERSVDPVFDDAALDAALTIAPRGALAWALTAVLLMLAMWMLLYFGLFIPRGPIA